METRWKFLILSGCFFVLIIFLCLTDFVMSRGNRIHIELEKERILKLRDCIILFTKDRKKFPKKLSELIPGYCSKKELSYQCSPHSEKRIQYKWNPETGELCCSDPFAITGLYPRTKQLVSIKIQKLQVKVNPLNGDNIFSQPPNEIQVGQESVVAEMENMQFMTYGWQVDESDEASGGAYLHIKEGTGDFESEDKIKTDPRNMRSGDFYNITTDQRRIKAGLFFQAPKAGTYYVYARTMAQRSHCSNITYIKINKLQRKRVGNNGSQPFTWRWHLVGIFKLNRGVNQLCFMTHQDGVRIDQVLFSPKKRTGLKHNSTFTGGFRNDFSQSKKLPPLNFSFKVNTLNITEEEDPLVFIYVHKNISDPIEARLDIQLDLPGGRIRLDAHKISLKKELTRFPCRIDLPRPLERKEYLLKATLFIDKKAIEERTLVLSHGYDWKILGPLPYMKTFAQGPIEKDETLKSEYIFHEKTFYWQQYDEKKTEQFCMMDFGLMFSERTYFAMNDVCLYAYTEVNAGKKGHYMMKIQADDNIVVWVNGKKTAWITEKGPPIRTAKEVKIILNKGKNRLLFRLNQKESQWQASIRIRTADDKVADVKGIFIH